ncbi:MAG: hypothetical protein L6R40_007188 [Gallowayella cf. fulva]|nr:MAG: hypothetical protein L6R40_007188 [Xanthomendoza cf. fulva]
MEQIRSASPTEPVAQDHPVRESSTNPDNDINRRASLEIQCPARSPSLRSSLSARGRQVKDEIEKKTLEALAHIDGRNDDNDPSNKDHHTRELLYTFTKNTLRQERLTATVTEKSESCPHIFEERRTYSRSIRTNSVCSRTNSQRSGLSGFLNQARLGARIMEFDEYLERENLIPVCYRERLWRIRGWFDDFRAHRIQRDVLESCHLLDLDLEVQVAHLAHANVKNFSHLLVHVNVADDIKVRIRRYLRYSESMVETRHDPNNNQVLAILKTAAEDVRKQLISHPPEQSATLVTMNDPILRRDVSELRNFLKDIFLLRYDRTTPYRLDVHNLKLLGEYIRWRPTKDKVVAASLAERLGLHPVELDRVLHDRLDSLLRHTDVDPEYIKARLCNLENIWHWAYAYNPLAHAAEWTKLAGHFHSDRMQFEKIFPGEMSDICPERRIYRSNTKARVKYGMISLHGHYFASIESPSVFKLSDTAKEMDRRFVKQEKRRLQAIRVEEERNGHGRRRSKTVSFGSSHTLIGSKPSPLSRIRACFWGVMDALNLRQQSKTDEEPQ